MPANAANVPATARESGSVPGLQDRYRQVRDFTVTLIEPLEPEDCVIQTIPEVSPTKWHMAHVTWFFEEFCLDPLMPGYRRFDDRFAYLFNSYYWTVGEMHGRPRRGLLSRPTVAEVLEFRRHVDAAMIDLIGERGDDAEFRFLVTLGLNHEQQHQELLLTDIKHVFFSNPLGPVYRSPAPIESQAVSDLELIGRSGGRFEIGFDGDAFAFDNETPRHEVLLRDHAIANRLTTNGEYLEFIRDGGYEKPELWLSDGWAQIRSGGWSRPLCWSEDLTREFTLGGWQPIDPAAPVCHVSYYEADAFARWAGARLPTEQEWEVAADPVAIQGNTVETGALHPRACSVGDGVAQLWGDVWEWTASPYAPYPGFRPLGGSLGEYNGKFMANQIVVRGGSCVTSLDHIRSTYRSFFYPHDRWQFLGFRLAQDA
jgi:ergothioneine biosynthesis protein EgtB